MLAGLLFATHDTDDRPDRLAATLPFAGVTLIEYQARLLVAAGVSQIVVVVARLTPELLGAIARIGRRGLAVDPVRSAAEAIEKLHPLARILMLSDGLVTTEGVVAALAGDGGDALLVVPDDAASGDMERVGGQMAWAGVARIEPRRMAEVAALPQDYDLQSTLLRLAEQARAVHVPLPEGAIRGGHGIVHHARTLEDRGRALLSGIVADRRSWFDRYVLAPIARLALPKLVERQVASVAIAGAGVVLGAGGIAGVAFGWPATGLIAALLGCIVLGLGATLADLRDEPPLVRAQAIGIGAIPALAVLTLGWTIRDATLDDSPLVIAVVLIAIGALAERATIERLRRRWWATPPAYLAVVAVPALVGFAGSGLALAAVYATATLAAAVETLRRRP